MNSSYRPVLFETVAERRSDPQHSGLGARGTLAVDGRPAVTSASGRITNVPDLGLSRNAISTESGGQNHQR